MTKSLTDGPLYKTLVKFLPTMVQDPFSDEPKLNIRRLHSAVGMSHEGVYKWLRSSRLTPENVDCLLDLAKREVNVQALRTLGRTIPTIQDFVPFVFTAA